MLHPEFSVRREVRARFVREGYVANSVSHPGVVAVLDDDVDEAGAAFLVMELLEGASVDALFTMTGEPVPVREALGIGYQLLDVLAAAHEKSVIHRDIKPANLFLLKSGQLKVIDFGIARLREADTGLKSTRTGATLGTPAFMPPEQALAVPGDIDARTDIWAAGATLFTMLSARFVHEGENARQMMIRAATEPARSLGSVAPDVPMSVIDVVTRALMFERDARWQSAAAMRDALLGVHRELFGEPSRADLEGLLSRTSGAMAVLPTEPSPVATAPTERSRATAVEISAARAAESRALVSTTSRPVSSAGDVQLARRRLGAAVAAVTLLGAGGMLALRLQGPSAGAVSTAPPAEASSGQPATSAAPAERATEPPPAPVLDSPTPPLPDHAAPAPETLPAGSTPELRKVPAPSHASARLRPRTMAAAAKAAPPTPAPTSTTAPANPLKLELQ
jgi:serine/threonine-protein kinase